MDFITGLFLLSLLFTINFDLWHCHIDIKLSTGLLWKWRGTEFIQNSESLPQPRPFLVDKGKRHLFNDLAVAYSIFLTYDFCAWYWLLIIRSNFVYWFLQKLETRGGVYFLVVLRLPMLTNAMWSFCLKC